MPFWFNIGAHHHGFGHSRFGRSGHPLRHREFRFGSQTALERYPDAPRQRSGRFPQGHRLPDPPHGRRIRQLLHQGGDADPDPGVPVARRGNEKDRPQGRQAVLLHRRRRGAVHQGGDPAAVLQELLEPPHGAGPQELPAARRHHRRDRDQGRGLRDNQPHRRRPEGRERTVPQDGDGEHREDNGKSGRGRHRLPTGGAADRRNPLRLPGTDHRRRRHAKRVRHHRQSAREAGQAVPAADLRHHPVATEQQVGEGTPTGRRSHIPHSRRDEDLSGREVDGALGRRVIRIPRGGIPGSTRQHSGRVEGDRERDRHDQDDAADQGPAASPHADPQESTREGAGELHRPGRAHRRQRSRVCFGARVDANLLRAPGAAQGAQEGHPTCYGQHFRVHRQGYRSSRRLGHSAE